MAIPSIILGVIRRSKFSLFFLVLLFGLVSYMFIPLYSSDRARYFEIYEDFKNSSFTEMFYFFFLSSQDFILQSLFYFASQIEIPAQLVFACVTMFTVSVIFFLYYKIIDSFYINKIYGLLSLIILFLSISYLDLLSGTRFMFACSFVLLGYYFGIIKKNKYAILYLIIALFVHFSTIIFIPIFLLLKFFFDSKYIHKILFIFSLVFIFLPRESLYSIYDIIPMGDALESKSNMYLKGEDFINEGLSKSDGALIINYISYLNVFAIYLYLILTKNTKEDIYRKIVLTITAFSNLFYSSPTVFFRYVLLIKLFFILMLIRELYINKNKIYIYIFGVIFFMNVVTQIIISRNNIELSFFNKESLLLITIVDKENISSKDFIY